MMLYRLEAFDHYTISHHNFKSSSCPMRSFSSAVPCPMYYWQPRSLLNLPCTLLLLGDTTFMSN